MGGWPVWLSPARPGLRVGDMGTTAAPGSQPLPRTAGLPGERQICPVLVGRDDLVALEAGIGKTRLLTQIIARAIDLGFSAHSAGAYPRDHQVAEEVRLARLSPQDTAVMSAAISGIVLPEDVTDGLFARSDGIPLHIKEFMATIAGSGPAAKVPDREPGDTDGRLR